jgi:hypothetical protein
MPSTSPLSTAAAKRPTSSRSRWERGSGARSRLPLGRRACSVARALQRALDRGLAAVEHVRHLGGVEAEHVAQHQHGALARREVLECRDERQRYRLAGLVARLGRGRAVRHAFEQHVRVGLQPDRLGPAGGLGWLEHRIHLARPARAVAQRVQAPVRRYAVEPGAQRGSALVALESAPGRQERLLQQILGVLERAEDAVAVQLELLSVGIGELAEGVLVSRARPRERGLAQHAVLASPGRIASITDKDTSLVRNGPAVPFSPPAVSQLA